MFGGSLETVSDFNSRANSPQFEEYSLFTNRRAAESLQIRRCGEETRARAAPQGEPL